MSLQHFFLDKQIIKNEIDTAINKNDSGIFKLDLSPEDLHHANVLRLKPKEHIGVIDANSVFYECEIYDISPSSIQVKNITKSNYADDKIKPNIDLWLCSGILKGSKLDSVVRHTTELGVNGFVPVIFERCVSRYDEKKAQSKVVRWQKIVKSAAMQSGQKIIPKVKNVTTIKKLCQDIKDFDVVVVCWEEALDNKALYELADLVRNKNQGSKKDSYVLKDPTDTNFSLQQSFKIAIIVGPEGGISCQEIDYLKENISRDILKITSISNTILRSETACISACSIIGFLIGK